MSEEIELLIATTNLDKVKELNDLFRGLKIQLTYLKNFSDLEEVEETGTTFEENAELKALGYARQTGLLTLAEDSGLCCDALEGAPGVHSARFAGERKKTEENNAKILRLLKDLPDNCRGAHYKSAITLASPNRVIKTFVGEVHGSIAREEKGRNGFGYDPLFYYLPFKCTFGEATAAMKQQVSHRANAFKQVKVYLSECSSELKKMGISK